MSTLTWVGLRTTFLMALPDNVPGKMPASWTGDNDEVELAWRRYNAWRRGADRRQPEFDANGRPKYARWMAESSTWSDLRKSFLMGLPRGAPGHLPAGWTGEPAELERAWERSRGDRHRHRDDRARAAVRRMQLRAHPRGHRKARDATKAGAQAILSYDAKAFEDAAYGDVGDLGDRKCVHCGALLFAGEAVRAGAGCWRGKTCCCKGTVQLDPIGRSEAIDELFETPRHAKTLTQHARRCFCPGAPNCACTPACCWRAPTSSSPLPPLPLLAAA